MTTHLHESKSKRIRIDRGRDASNQGLSERRAAAVKKYLVDKGIKESRIEVEAFGEKSPMVPNDNANNRALNRRVTFKVLKK